MGVHVLHPLETCPVKGRAHRPGVAAPALPPEPDTPKPRGRQFSVRLLETYGADDDSVQHDHPRIGE